MSAPDRPVSRRELLALVRALRRIDRLPAEARAAVMARKRAMVARLEPGWYDDEDLTEADSEIEATEMLELLAAGSYGHPDVEGRPSDPTSPEWAAMVEQLRARHAAAVEALAELELDCAASSGSFPDALREVLGGRSHPGAGRRRRLRPRPGARPPAVPRRRRPWGGPVTGRMPPTVGLARSVPVWPAPAWPEAGAGTDVAAGRVGARVSVPACEAEWWGAFDLCGGSGPVDAARRATEAVFGVDPAAPAPEGVGR